MKLDPTPEQVLAGRGAIRERYSPGAAAPDADALPTVSAATLAGRPLPQRRFLDSGQLFPHRNVTMLSGDGGTGKSLLALQLAVAVASGSSWFGLEVQKGKALYLSAEDDLDELHMRLDAICAAEACDLSRLRGLGLVVLAGEDAVLGVEKEPSVVTSTDLLQRLRMRLDVLRPRLLVLDNLADIFAGNENSRPLARQFIAMLRRGAIDFDCTVLLLSHPSLSGMSSGSGTSGNTAWNNSVRSRLYLTREKDDSGAEQDPDLRVLQTMKANYGPAGGRVSLRWEDGRFLRTDRAECSGNSPAARSDFVRRVFLHLLSWHNMKKKPVSPSKSPAYAPAVFERHPHSEGIRSREFEVAMNVLLDSSEIHIAEEGPPSKRRLRLRLGNADG